jgi:hypothetical protein
MVDGVDVARLEASRLRSRSADRNFFIKLEGVD